MRHALGAVLVVSTALALTSGTSAGAHGAGPTRNLDVSIGAPNQGALVGGERLPTGPHLRVLSASAGRNADWGLRELVSMLDGAAREVRHEYPGAITSLGDLSGKGGRQLAHHHSHQSGRDADVAFFLVDDRGREVLGQDYIAIDANGRAPQHGGVVFDDARNWSFVRSLVTSTHAHVMAIFVADWIRDRLVRYARRVSDPGILRQATAVMLQPSDAPPHDDHFHVRISCPARMLACVEWPMRRSDGVTAAITTAMPDATLGD
jgi:penicillin-insensitive murein DD-endopeptidase